MRTIKEILSHVKKEGYSIDTVHLIYEYLKTKGIVMFLPADYIVGKKSFDDFYKWFNSEESVSNTDDDFMAVFNKAMDNAMNEIRQYADKLTNEVKEQLEDVRNESHNAIDLLIDALQNELKVNDKNMEILDVLIRLNELGDKHKK